MSPFAELVCDLVPVFAGIGILILYFIIERKR